MLDGQLGWIEDNGSWYYLFLNGQMAIGWKQITGEWYYFYSDGSMAWGRTVDGYFLDIHGKWIRREGWQKDENEIYYYVGPNEKAVTGWNRIDGEFYYFYSNGSMTYSNTVSGFYLNSSGKVSNGTGWLQDGMTGDWYYYSNGEASNGWVQDDSGAWYYTDDYGRMVTGWKQVDGDWYYFYSDGEMATGWVNDNGDWYFLYNNGSMAHNDTEGGYHVDLSGKMVTGSGWIHVDSWWYYLDDTGKVINNWLYNEGNWYYLYPEGSMANAEWINGYYVDDNGEWIPNMDNIYNSEGSDINNSQDTHNTYKEPRLNDKVMNYIKGTQTFKWFMQETQKGGLKSFFDIGGFDRDENGVYHAKQDAIVQSRAGYNDLYDDVFSLGCSMNKGKYEFETSSGKYIVWLWKGDYLNLGAGAEIGIYKDGGPLWECDIEDAMPMKLRIQDKDGNLIFDWKPSERTWWCTGFNPKYQNMQEQNLTVYGSIDFSNHLDMWDAFYKRWNGNLLWNFQQKPVAKYIWK